MISGIALMTVSWPLRFTKRDSVSKILSDSLKPSFLLDFFLSTINDFLVLTKFGIVLIFLYPLINSASFLV